MKDFIRRVVGQPLILILLATLIVRMPGMADRPLWYDEAFAVLFASKGPAAMAYGTLTQEAGVAADIHPLGYYSALWLWMKAFGTSAFAVRSLSLVFGLGIVALGYLLARELFGGRVAAVAGWLLAFSPFQVHYAQEARMYALLGLILLGATLAYWYALRGKAWAWVAFTVLAAAAMYVHNLAALYLLCLALTPLILRRWRMLGLTVLAGLAAMALYSPWLVRLPSQMARVQWAYWIAKPGLPELVRSLLVFVSGLPLPDWGLPVALFVAVLVVIVWAWAIVRGLKTVARSGRRAAWLALLSAAPVLLMFLVSQWQPVYLDRAMLPAGAMFMIGAAWALGSPVLPLAPRRGLLIAICGGFAIGLFSFYLYRGFPYAPFGDVNAMLRQSAASQEIVLHSNKITALPAVYDDPSIDHRYLADPAGTGSDTLALATQHVLGLYAESDVESAAGDAPGVWFIIFSREIDDYLAAGLETHPALSWLQESFELQDLTSYGELDVYHFTR